MTTVFYRFDIDVEIDTNRWDHLHPSIALEAIAAEATDFISDALDAFADDHVIRLVWSGRVRPGRPDDYDDGPYHIDDPRSNG